MEIENLKKQWLRLQQQLPAYTVVKEDFFEVLLRHYSSPQRYYHTLRHIAFMLAQCQQFKYKVEDLGTLQWAIWYHDVIYNPLRSDNEEKSARLAEKHLVVLQADKMMIEKVSAYILATKKHQLIAPYQNFDAQLMLDCDLAVLGSTREDYLSYTQAIRKEYAMYPDFLYKKGRRKALQSFLQKERIFLTEEFYQAREEQARKNLAYELGTL
ncbi:hypothetical protein AAG747_00995 [Rapidithrix thailandica]|uniref:Metal-dependent HD superfamily phosphohydrolase n=1 Tax=Rapidithrix thailandica TaxID=413964 RepID=A0AAW9RNH6_9BACT